MPDIPPRKSLMNPELRRRGIYVLPNLLTTAALFAGFYAIVQAMTGRFEHAAVAIFVAMVFDGLDGRVARLTRTQSAFGAEYDSLSDMVSFGAAPALIAFEWAMKGMGKWGWIAAFVYCAGAALRLARFNTNIGIVDKRYFQGLAKPGGGGLGCRLRLDHQRPEYSRRGSSVVRVRPDPVLRHHHGQHFAVLEWQGHQSASQCALHRTSCHRAGLRAGLVLSTGSSVCAVPRLCPVWICDGTLELARTSKNCCTPRVIDL
jgi:CDP-diacylglycerol--serine O-phosphatidyltransferase